MVAYLVAGDPDLESTLELMHGFVNAESLHPHLFGSHLVQLQLIV